MPMNFLRRTFRAIPWRIRRELIPFLSVASWLLRSYRKARGPASYIANDSLPDFGAYYDILVLCPNYPADDDEDHVGGEFIRSRVRAYTGAGLTVLITAVSHRNVPASEETQGRVRILRMPPDEFVSNLKRLHPLCGALAVHSPTPQVADAIHRTVTPEKVTYWFHGSEIRDYRRLYYNYTTPQMEAGRASRDHTHRERVRVARRIFETPQSRVVFVSKYLRGIAETDTRASASNGVIIPNYIDGDFYTYRAKTPQQRKKILLIRSFVSKNYAPDIAIKAIEHLLATPLGQELSFTVRGFGTDFRTLTAGLHAFANVDVREGFLERDEMRSLHQTHGIFLAPSRHDTQGVTMCEAMASGLVPVTHNIGGIPEFVDRECGELCNSESPVEFADAIARIATDADLFLSKSAAAAERMRELCNATATIDKEIALLKRNQASSDNPLLLILNASENFPRFVDVNCVHLVSEGRTLRSLSETDEFTLPLPALQACRYAYSDLALAQSWAFAAAQIAERFGRNATLIISGSDPLIPLALLCRQHFGIDFVVADLNADFRMNPTGYAVLGAAAGCFLHPALSASEVGEKYIGPIPLFDSAMSTSELIEQTSASVRNRRPAIPPATAPGVTKVLLVAYFSGPCSTVGVSRVNYWAQELDRISQGQTETHLATAIAHDDVPGRVHYVPDLNGIALTDNADLASNWVSEFVQTEQALARHVNTLSYYWRIALERYFDARSDQFDVVIISGNPFACFDFAAFAKAKWGARVLLDYRDPFAYNPVMKYPDESRRVAAYTEAGYNFQADLIMTVNNRCVALIAGGDEHRTAVVDNGFDERVTSTITAAELTDDRICLVHAGSFNNYRNPGNLIAALDPGRHRLHHVGRQPELDASLASQDRVVMHGVQPYTQTLEIVAGADCGVVFISPNKFESTTKIFDYLCFDLDVIIVSPDGVADGPLADLCLESNKVHWLADDPQAMREFFADYTPAPRDPARGARYSREASTRELLNQIETLIGTGAA